MARKLIMAFIMGEVGEVDSLIFLSLI